MIKNKLNIQTDVDRLILLTFILVTSFVFVGCESHYTTIRLKPVGGELERVLIDDRLLKRDGAAKVPYGVGDRVAHYYAEGTVRPGSASASFKSAMPEDVGGSGSYRYSTTEAGESFLYMERFIGPTQRRLEVDLTLIDARIERLELAALELLSPGKAEEIDRNSAVGAAPGSSLVSIADGKESWRIAIHSVLFGFERDFTSEVADLDASREGFESTLDASILKPESSSYRTLGERRDDVAEERAAWEDALEVLHLTKEGIQEDALALGLIRKEMISLLAECAEATAKVRPKMDPWLIMERIDDAVDEGVEYLIRWWEWELSDSPYWPQIKESLDGVIRRDLKSLALLLTHSDIDDAFESKRPSVYGDIPVNEAHALALLFLEERGLNLRQVLRDLELVFSEGPSEEGEALIDYLRGALESFFGVPLHFLEIDQIESSYGAHVQREHAIDPDFEFDVLPFGFPSNFMNFGGGEYLNVNLALPGEPITSNGRYDPSRKLVSWNGLDLRKEGAPLVLYCHWVIPDEDWQTIHLGSARALDGPELSLYVSCCDSLVPEDLEAWNSFLADLKPDESGIQAISEFSFSGKELRAHESLPSLLSTAIKANKGR